MQRYAWNEEKGADFDVKLSNSFSASCVTGGGCSYDPAVKGFGGVLCLDLDGLGCWILSCTPVGPDPNTG